MKRHAAGTRPAATPQEKRQRLKSMKHNIFTQSKRLAAILVCALPAAMAAPIQIVGTLQDTHGVPLEGAVTVFEEGPQITSVTHSIGIEKGGEFKVQANNAYGILVTAVVDQHPPAEQYIPAGTIGPVTIDFEIPPG